jgi:hypothetical protein
VESSIGHRRRRFPYAFSGIGGAEFSKKSDPNDYKWTAIGDGTSTKSAGYLALKIEDRTETDLTLKGLVKCVRNSMRPDALL